ncbi:alpha/beta fold hydrolase [Halococcus saccharolyticus]|uniref:Alpha/beta hydrolase fold protein n=1 Tax=Halococcus saccharolyticus DSM 5350 TaxID=1227455 RepID=M0MPF9_9EURY|nr:alpha/beta hydrolase [Halococcus saccharolyticus]EMA47258.1 alpha/beta hydrolase fold protein [Halococcus saccharolyticus DSM 5350]
MNHDEWAGGQATTTVTVDGHDLSVAYRDDGPGDSGSDDSERSGSTNGADEPPVVFLHGIPTWSFLWRDIAPTIAEDRRVIVPDLLGYGNSTMADGFDRSIRAQEAMLAALLEELGIETVSIVSHDIGGGVALRYAANHPDTVAKLVCSNAVCYDSWPVEFITDFGLPETTERPIDDIEDEVSSAFTLGAYGDPDPEFVEGLTAPWLSEEGRTSLSRCAVATNTNHTTEIDYGAITADFLGLWGAGDDFQQIEYGERLADDLDGEVVELDEAYHWVMADRTEAYVAELREFLTLSAG